MGFKRVTCGSFRSPSHMDWILFFVMYPMRWGMGCYSMLGGLLYGRTFFHKVILISEILQPQLIIMRRIWYHHGTYYFVEILTMPSFWNFFSLLNVLVLKLLGLIWGRGIRGGGFLIRPVEGWKIS